MMASSSKDEVFEFADKNYKIIKKTVEKEGYREGATDGRDSIFQESFDHGYEDGFRIGFKLGLVHNDKARRGNCALCSNPSLLEKPENESREIHRKQFDQENSTSNV